MSKTVDERIVQMQFQNSSFEKNIQTSMSSIDKLNESLNLTGASKGLESVSSAAKNLNFSEVSDSVSTLSSRFSALEVMGVTALANITNSAVNAGKKIVSALTVDPIKAGFNEYELKMDSIKTIMASTGEDLSTVKGYLEELNEYSDQTIYSFSDMTQNIGKFTNAGVELEDAVLAIKGVANEAALSGASAQEASRAMYNFAQAMSSGYVKLIDWKSIENANMATVGFKKELLATAEALGTVVKNGDKYKTVTTNAKGEVSDLFDATSMFNDSLNHQWMTTEVLTETLKRYTDTSTKIGQDATNAATQVTKLSQAFDVMKETAQSGWAKTWELIFGDLEQAKAVFTGLTNFVTGVIDSISDTRNAILEMALGGNPFSNIFGKIDSSGITKISEATEKLTGDLEYYQDVVNKVWHGDYKNADTGRYGFLEDAGYDHRIVQDLVNKGLGYKLTVEDIAASQKKFGVAVSDSADSVGTIVTALEDLTDEQLKNAGLTDEEIKMFRELGAEAKRTGVPLSELLESMSKVDGRTHLIEAFSNLGKTISTLFGAIRSAWSEVFPSESAASTLYNVLEGFHNLTEKFLISEETADKLKRTFAGVFSIIGIGADIIKKIISVASKAIGLTLDGILPMGGGILGVTAAIGDFIVGFRQAISSVDGFKSVMSGIGSKIGTVIEAIKNAFSKVIEVAKSIKSFDDFKQVGIDIMSGLVNGIKEKLSIVVEPILSVGRLIIDTIKDFLGIHSPSLVFMAIGGFIIAGLAAGLKDTSSISDSFGSIFSIFDTFIKGVITIVQYLGKILDPIIRTIGDIFKGLFGAINNAVASGDPSVIFDAINTGFIGTLVLSIKKFIDSLSSIPGGIGGIFDGIKGVLDGVKGSLQAYQNAINSEALMNIAKAVAILVVALIALSFVDGEKILSGLGTIGAIMLELGLMIKKSSLENIGPRVGAGILLLAFGLLVLSGAIAILGNMNIETLGVGIAALGAMLFVLTTALNGMTNNAKSMLAAGVAISLISSALLVLAGVIGLLGLMGLDTLAKGLIAMAGMLFIITVALNGMSNNAKSMIAAGVAIEIVAQGLLILSGALAILGNLEWSTIIKGLVAMGAMLLMITASFNLVDTNGVLKSASAFLVMGVAMTILSGALAIMGNMSLETIGKGLLAMGVALAEMVIALNLMKGTIAGSAALVLAAIALSILAPVLLALGVSAPIAAIGLAVIAGAFLVLGVAGLVLSPLVPVIVALSAAIALLGIGMGACGAGILAFATGLTMISILGGAAAQALTLVFRALIDLIPYAMESLGNGIVTIIGILGDGAAAIADSIGKLLQEILTVILDLLEEVAPRVVRVLMEVISIIVDNLVVIVQKHMPTIMQILKTIILGILNIIKEAIPELISIVGVAFDSLLEFILEYVPKLAETALELVVALLDGLAEGIPDIIESGVDMIDAILQGIAEGAVDLAQAGIDAVIAFISGMAEVIGSEDNQTELWTACGDLVLAIVSAIGAGFSKITEVGKQILYKIAEALGLSQEDIDAFFSKAGKIIDTIVDGIVNSFHKLLEIGGKIIDKLKEGIGTAVDNAKEWFEDTGEDIIDGVMSGLGFAMGGLFGVGFDIGDAIAEGAKDSLDINSPSKVFIGIAKSCVEGLAVGLKKTSRNAGNAAANLAETVTESFGNPMLKISDALVNEIDSQPTIRPVIDLSAIRKGANAIGGMFADETLSINAQPFASLAASMSGNQNGNNNDIVSAINKLRKDIANNPKTVNNINGVTYDDGSNIVGAVASIVRYATIEGRSK